MTLQRIGKSISLAAISMGFRWIEPALAFAASSVSIRPRVHLA
jgi:hypothetical protein